MITERLKIVIMSGRRVAWGSFTCLTAGTLAVLLLASGCGSGLGPRAIYRERYDYNQFLAKSQHEQLLLNLVRLRYQDPPQFLELNNVVASYTFSASMGGSMSLHSNGDQSGGPNGNLSVAEHPTVTYTPLQGSEFARRMLSPIPGEAVILLCRSGWNIERLMRLCVIRINNLENAVHPPGSFRPGHEEFHSLVDDLRQMQKSGALVLDLAIGGTNNIPRIILATPEEMQGEDLKLNLEVRKKLGLNPKQREFQLTGSIFNRTPDEIAIQGRSLLSVLFFLSHAVEVPEAHVKEGLVKVRKDDQGNTLDHSVLTEDLITIKCQRMYPGKAFVSVLYRGYWYYIADNDPNSKTTFSLLTYLFSLQAAPGNTAAPMLTLPITR